MSNTINVTFNADTGKFVANTENATKAVARSAEAVAKAKNDIVASFKMQVAAAKEVGASHQELEAIQRRAASMMANVSEQNATRVINSLDRIAEKNKKVAQELGALKIASPLPSGGGHEVSDRMAASATVRGLENGNPGIRSIENFLTTIPGVSKAMQAIFPVIGAAGLTGLLVNMGIEGYEAFHKVQHAAEETRDAFQVTHDKAVVSIDDLEIQNQKIQDQIDKLSGHPNNGLASALLEAKKMADSLMVSLQNDRKELEALLKEHSTGAFGSALSVIGLAPTSTGRQDKELLNDQSKLWTQLRAITLERDAATAGITDPKVLKAATDKYARQVHDAYQVWIDTYAREGKRLKDAEVAPRAQREADIVAGGSGKGDDFSGQIANIEGRTKQLLDAQRTADLQARILTGNESLGEAKQKHENGELAAKAEAARRKAAEAQLKGMEDILSKRKQLEQLDVVDEILFWQSKLSAAAKYPENLSKVNSKLGTLQQEYYRSLDNDAKKAVEAQKKRVEEAKRQDAELLSLMEKWEQQVDSRANSSARLDEAQSRAKIAMQEWTLSQQVATGVLTRHDAAVQMAILHAEDYAKQLAELDREQDADAQRSTLTDDERATRQNNRDVKRTELISKRDIAAAQDGVNIVATTWQGALKNANAAWVQDARDSAKQVADLYEQALSGLNDNLSNLMVGKKTDFAGMFQGLGKTLASDSLKHLEAPILGAFGMSGKADGSDANPFSVKVVGGNFASGAADGLKGIFGGDDDDSGGGFFHKAAGFIGSIFGGHKALGGGVKAGVTYDVGEMGREEFTPSVDGYITPHNKASGGTSANYFVTVANGVTPEQFDMKMRAALHDYHQNVMPTGARAAVRDAQQRTFAPRTR